MEELKFGKGTEITPMDAGSGRYCDGGSNCHGDGFGCDDAGLGCGFKCDGYGCGVLC